MPSHHQNSTTTILVLFLLLLLLLLFNCCSSHQLMAEKNDNKFPPNCLPASGNDSSSKPIEQFFPEVFAQGTGIMVKQECIHTDVPALVVQPFQDQKRVHFEARPPNGTIKYLIMHYTVADFNRTMDLFTMSIPSGRVSAHYVITEKEFSSSNDSERKLKVGGGHIVQVVPEANTSWHAGVSAWGPVDRNLNNISLGIEHVNPGFVEEGENKTLRWFPYDEDQVEMSGQLSRAIVQKYGIKPYHVLAHADIQPENKQDPGILFPWAQLHERFGVGAWLDRDERSEEAILQRYGQQCVQPLPSQPNATFFLRRLRDFGYNVPSVLLNTENTEFSDKTWAAIRPVLHAFRSHFSANGRPEAYDRRGITTEDQFWAWALTAKYGLMSAE